MTDLERNVHLIKLMNAKPGDKDWNPGEDVDYRVGALIIFAFAIVLILLAL